MLWTVVALLAAAGALAAAASAVRPWARSRELAAELRSARAALGGRRPTPRAAAHDAGRPPPGGRPAGPGRTIGGAGSAAQRG